MTTRFLAGLALGLLGAASASATSFSSLTTFGDSLSDTGNIFIATGGTVPVPPYFAGRFSDGPVWIDALATQLGLPSGAVPALAGGSNYAFGGARTGTDLTPPGLLAQSVGLWGPATPIADPTGLYVLLGGGNDMRDARSTYQTALPVDQAGRQTAAEAAAGNLMANLGFLASRGAKNVLLGNLPDLGETPEAAFLGLIPASSDASARFNSLMPLVLATGASFGLNMYFLDLAGIAAAVRVDALTNGGAVYGITNVLTPCGTFEGSIGIPCDVSLFSDALHPSARAHELLGLAAYAAVVPRTVPEPGSLALLGLALLTMSSRLRRVRR